MFPQGSRPFLMFMLSTIFLNDVNGQCVAKKDKNGMDFPDPRKLYQRLGIEYALKVEVNDIQNRQSMYATEYYYKDDKTGRVDTHFNGIQKTFLYKMDTKEGFIFGASPNCQTINMTNDVKPPHEDFNVYDWKYGNSSDVLQFGPFSMLLKGYESELKGGLQYVGTRMVRGLIANEWKRCPENNLEVRYMLIDEDQSGPIFGYGDLAIPLRITVEGMVNASKPINQSYEFVHFQDGFTDAVEILSIPFNKGCERLIFQKNITNENFNLAYEAEVVLTVYSPNDTHIYITDLKAALDNASQLFEYTTIPWIAHQDVQFANPGDELFRVFDVRNGYLYELDLENTKCKISATTIEKTGEDLELPDGDKVSLLDPNIIILDETTSKEFKYLGEGTERGKKVNVFERKWVDGVYTKIATRYYLADGQEAVSETKERKALVKVVYTEYIANSRTTSLVFNFYHYQKWLTNDKRKFFDVSICFQEQNQTEWFQVIFPIADVPFDSIDILQAIPQIRDNFLKTLALDHITTPVRIPRIMVDFDADFLYITAALYERVPAKLDFQFEGDVRLIPISRDVALQGITTEEGCFQACIQHKKCKAINYCGVNCALLLNQNYTSGIGTKDEKCAVYSRVKMSTQLTIEEVNNEIEERIGSRDFRIGFNDRNHTAQTLHKPEFRKGIAFGINNFKDDGAKKQIDTSFTIFKQGYNMKNTDSTSTQSFAECQRECLRDPTCEAFSFCEFTSSCTFSKYHSEDINVKDLSQDDKCIILSRNYIYLFNEYGGISKTTKAEVEKKEYRYTTPEACAMGCIKEDSIECRSFDLCSDSGTPKCYLHSTHVLDSKGDEVQGASNCVHYSRNYLIDFKEEKGKAILEGPGLERISNLQTAEECAKLCIENSECKTFDFCRKPFETKSQCYISVTVPSEKQKKDDKSCSLYTRSDVQTGKMLADGDGKQKEVKVVEIIEDTGYSKSLTGGIAFFLFLVGIAIGGAAMFGYGYYKANRRI